MQNIRLSEISTRAPEGFDKKETKEKNDLVLEELDELQNLLYAESKHSVLVVLQGMDASGKDGVIRNVFGSLNPQGIHVHSFKVPTEEELSHDFLWRIHKSAPAKGVIGIFNRSHYEDILVTRVHKWCDDELAHKRMQAINDFEHLLQVHNNTTILKFYLHVSVEEQQERLQERINDPRKQWKYNEKDHAEAKLRDEYIRMYEDCFKECNKVPWTIVPADQNWYKEHLIASAVRDALVALKMEYPKLKNK
ncbi:MAG: PPK2 family polyphosphate kinase [Chitinophagaceae bacterium]